jgi:hypothetical protein
MRPAYTLQASAVFSQDPKAKGTTECSEVFVVNGQVIVEKHRALPELGPKRVFARESGPLVLPIQGRRFKVTFASDVEDGYDYDYGCPSPSPVTFEETDEPETPYEVWDAKAHLEGRIAFLERDYREMTQAGCSEDDMSYTKRQLQEAQAELEHGAWGRYSPNNKTSAFGQPVFIQNKDFPVYEGRAAFHLVTFETGWGDCGNENYMVALDGDGYPAAVFHEASCC